MVNSLTGYVNSDYQSAANALTSKKIVVVYVEDVSDKPFWFDVLLPYQARLGVVFEIRCYSNNSLATGSVQIKKMIPCAGKYLLVCMDSDYDYLLERSNPNQYVFQTYAYAPESIRCYAESLHQVCVQATLNETALIDFVIFLGDYSRKIYELLIYNIYFYQEEMCDTFSIDAFAGVVSLDAAKVKNDYLQALAQVDENVKSKLSELKQSHPNITTQAIEGFADRLKLLGLTEENAYLFMHGHTLEDNVVGLLLKSVCQQLKKLHFKSIEQHQGQADVVQTNNQKKHYDNLTSKVMTVLRNNTNYKDCFLFLKTRADIDNYEKCFSET